MRTTTFLSVLQAIAAKVLGTADHLPTQQGVAFTESVNEHVRDCWDREFWPDWTVTEQRYFRDTWSATSYAAGAQVYHAGTNAYYAANASAISTDVPGTSSKWTLLTGQALRRYISREQTGKTVIGAVLCVTELDPRLNDTTPAINWRAGADGIEFSARLDLPTSVWVTFRKVPPEFTLTAWTAASYASGARVYQSTTGECYVANAATSDNDVPGTSSKWTRIEFPLALKTPVVLFVAADRQEEAGQLETSSSLRQRAEDALVDEFRRMGGQQGMVRPYRVLTRAA
ncbi:MAG: hypothetical protein EBR82_25430 [Caulobacteraceae bacterium]|nr:hypothetical protein [Caulobacteraceae bacterium]